MKDKIFYFSLIILLFSLSACNKNTGDDTVKEELDKPDVTMDAGIIDGTEEEIELIDGLKKTTYGEYALYIPYIKNNEKIKGVNYLEDDIEGNLLSNYRYYLQCNKPEGCDEAALKANSMSFYNVGTPPFQDSYVGEPQTEYSAEAFTTYSDSNNYEKTKPYNQYYAKYDVQGISFCLYEDFYDNCPEVKISVYGVTSDVLKKYLGDENKYASTEYYDMNNKFKSNGYSECDLICSKIIESSGVYYIDYNDLNKNEMYKQFIIRIEFDEYIENYSYDVCGMYKYNIKDNDKFQTWKSSNNKWILGE